MCNKDMVLTWAKQVIRTLKMSLNPISLIIDWLIFAQILLLMVQY